MSFFKLENDELIETENFRDCESPFLFKSEIYLKNDKYTVATLVLPIKHFGGQFETVIFKKCYKNIWMTHCYTLEEAKKQHLDAIKYSFSGEVDETN